MVLSKKRARKVLEEIIALFPDAKPSLDFTNHFELLVAVMLSAQTTDAAVNKATPGLFAAFPTPQAMSVATESEIASHISRLGLYRNKAKFLKKMCPTVTRRFRWSSPSNTRGIGEFVRCWSQDSQCCHECGLWDSSFCSGYSCGAYLQTPRYCQKISDTT